MAKIASNPEEGVPLWLRSLSLDESKISPECLQEGEDFLLATAMSKGTDKKPFRIMQDFAPIHPNLFAAVGAIVSLRKYSDLPALSGGLDWSRLTVVAAVDKDGFGVLFEAAKKERDARRFAFYQDEIVDRVKDGSSRPVVLRRGHDHDVVEMVKVKNDSLLAKATEFTGEMLSPGGGGGAGGGSTHIGNQINFVLELPSSLKGQQAGAAPPVIEAVEAEPS